MTIVSSNLGYQCHWRVAGDENDRARVIMIEMLGLTDVAMDATTKTCNGDHHVGTLDWKKDTRTLLDILYAWISHLRACFVD